MHLEMKDGIQERQERGYRPSRDVGSCVKNGDLGRRLIQVISVGVIGRLNKNTVLYNKSQVCIVGCYIINC